MARLLVLWMRRDNIPLMNFAARDFNYDRWRDALAKLLVDRLGHAAYMEPSTERDDRLKHAMHAIRLQQRYNMNTLWRTLFYHQVWRLLTNPHQVQAPDTSLNNIQRAAYVTAQAIAVDPVGGQKPPEQTEQEILAWFGRERALNVHAGHLSRLPNDEAAQVVKLVQQKLAPSAQTSVQQPPAVLQPPVATGRRRKRSPASCMKAG
jgi:hypothetical protein